METTERPLSRVIPVWIARDPRCKELVREVWETVDFDSSPWAALEQATTVLHNAAAALRIERRICPCSHLEGVVHFTLCAIRAAIAGDLAKLRESADGCPKVNESQDNHPLKSFLHGDMCKKDAAHVYVPESNQTELQALLTASTQHAVDLQNGDSENRDLKQGGRRSQRGASERLYQCYGGARIVEVSLPGCWTEWG